jgi:hypothetical protein
MQIVWIVLVVIGGLLLLNAALGLAERIAGPVKHPFNRDSTHRLLQILLNQGEDGFLLFLQRTGGSEFLQFRKYIRARGHPGIELGFPESPWSRMYIESLRGLLDRERINYAVAETGTEPTTAFILVDFGRDVSAAAEFAVTAVSEVYRLPQAEFKCYFLGDHDPRPSARIGF